IRKKGAFMKQVLALLLIVSLAFSGYLFYQLRIIEQKDHLVVYFVRSTPTNFLLVPVVRSCPRPATPEKALELLLEGPTPEEKDQDLWPSVSVGTKLLGLKISDGLASANFSKELQTNFVGGSQLEGHLVDAIVSTLIQFPEIEKIEILIEGERVESIAGHVLIEYHLP
ncbi:MAG: GerMN domain-containing protein, partial [Limnochordia bacterium]